MADGLFNWMDALYTKKTLEGTPPIFMLHRFLASDRDLAMAAHTLQLEIKRAGPRIAFRVWQGLLPKGQGAPRFRYVAAKKPPAVESLTARMMHVLGESRTVVEEMQGLVELTGRTEELYFEFGIEPPDAESQPDKVIKTTKQAGGLLSDI